MAELAGDSFTMPALGKQNTSSRKNAPNYSLASCSRDKRANVFISREASRSTPAPNASPGPVYELPDTWGKSGLSVKFTKGPQRVFGNWKANYPDSSNDVVGATIDSQPFRYHNVKGTLFGTDPKGQLKNATILKNHAQAFYGRQSPGPQAYLPDATATEKKLTHATPFGAKTKVIGEEGSGTDEQVGPGHYKRTDFSIGAQALSHRRNQPTFAFSKMPKFGGRKRRAGSEPATELKVNLSSFGKQVDATRRSEPAMGFGNATRAHFQRVSRCMTALDVGPVATMPRAVMSHPNLPVML